MDFYDLNKSAVFTAKTPLQWGSRCCIGSCRRSKRNDPSCRLFKFPIESSPYFQKWLKNCDISQENSASKRVCEKHFELKYFGKKYLKLGAIPTLNLNNDLNNQEEDLNESDEFKVRRSPSQKTYFGPNNPSSHKLVQDLSLEEIAEIDKNIPCCSRTESVIESACRECEKREKQLELYRRQNKILADKNRSLANSLKQKANELKKIKQKTKRYEENLKKLKNVGLKDMIQKTSASEESKTFCEMLLNEKKGAKWLENEKILAQSLQYKSNAAYTFMKDVLKFHLPSKSSLCRWAPIKQLSPGFNSCVLQNLSTIVDDMSENAKKCVMIFDEITIRKDLKYNEFKDEVTGFVDLGNERQPKVGKQICVFMLRGLVEKWKFVVSYYVSETCLTGSLLKSILLENIDHCSSLGFQIVAITCDQGSNNRACYEELGVGKEKPFWNHQGKKIYCLYDVPHLMKNIRNCLLQHDVYTVDGIAKWGVINQLYMTDKGRTTKLCPKLTQKHIDPNAFEKMRVSLATQVLSNSCSAAIQALAKLNKFNEYNLESSAIPTSKFLKTFNDTFDCLNSKSQNFFNNIKSPLKPESTSLKFLKDVREYLKNIKVKITRGKIYCFEGLEQTINGVILLSNELFKEENISEICTANFNQDPIENTFAQIRSRGGFNTNPSVYDFGFLIAKIMNAKFIFATTSSNCEPDGTKCLNESSESFQKEKTEITNFIKEIEPAAEESNDFEEDNEISGDFSFLQSFSEIKNDDAQIASIRYFVGYVLFKCLPKINCEQCTIRLIKQLSINEEVQPSEYLIAAKKYNKCNLQNPSDYFLEVCTFHISIFQQIFKKSVHERNLKQKILNLCIQETNNSIKYSSYFKDGCEPHKVQILDFLLLVLIRKNLTWMIKENKGRQCSVKTKNRRLNILAK